jgi:hypothetical protein
MSNIIDGLHIRLNSDSAPVVWRLSDETRALSSYIMFGAAFNIADLVFVREVSSCVELPLDLLIHRAGR